MTADPKILETIRKLAELANPEHGGFANEIATAAAKMQTLMEKYNISWAEVLLTKTEQERTQEFVRRESNTVLGGSMKDWHWALARCIGTITMTKHFASSRYGQKSYRNKNVRKAMGMCFFGAPEAAQLACDLFDEWVVRIDEMARAAVHDYCQNLVQEYGMENPIKNFRRLMETFPGDVEEDDHPNVWRLSWLNGVTRGISEVLWEREQARKAEEEAAKAKQESAPTNALMVLESALTVAYASYSVRFRSAHTGGGSRYNSAAHAAGKQVGRTLPIGAKKLRG